MGRLENIAPQLKAGQFEKRNTGTVYVTSEGTTTGLLTPALAEYLERCRGAYSIKEISLYIYDRHKDFRFADLYENLERWADSDFFKNSADILSSLRMNSTAAKPFAAGKVLTREELAMHLRKVTLFANLPAATITSVIEASEQKIYKFGEVIIKKDTIGEDSFVLLNGSVGVFSNFTGLGKSQALAILPPLSVFGESAAVAYKKRTADVVAMTDSLVLKMNLRKVDEGKAVTDFSKNLKLRLVFHQLMRLHPIFKNLPSDIVQMLLGFCQIEQIEAHKTVIQQGDEGHQFYIVLSGNVHVIKDRMPEVRLGVGAFFGEMGVLRRQVRTASIVTETDCTFLTLSEKNFVSLLASDLRLATEIEREISLRATPPPTSSELALEVDEEITKSLTTLSGFDFTISPVGDFTE